MFALKASAQVHARVLSRRISVRSVWCSLYWRSFETAWSGTLCDAVITVKCVLHAGVILQLRAPLLFLFLFAKGAISHGSKCQMLPGRHNKSAGGWWSCWAVPLMPRSLRKVLRYRIWLLRSEFSKAEEAEIQSSSNYKRWCTIWRMLEGLR